MRAPAILRILSLRRIQPRPPPSSVAPFPEKTRFDEQLTVELGTLQPLRGAHGLAQFLDTAIATQMIALQLFVNVPYRDDTDRRSLEDYLESNVEILDACNYFVDKIEIVKRYLDSLRVVLRLVDGIFEGNEMARTRALEHLESCRDIERKCKRDNDDNNGSRGLRRKLRKKLDHGDDETELSEIIHGSKAMALMACRFLELGLSFDSKRRLPPKKTESQATSSSWLRTLQDLVNQAEGSEKMKKRRSGSCLIMTELKETVNSARNLQEQMKRKREKEVKSAVEGLKRNCWELEDGLEIIEEKVKELYKNLIDVRMALLGMLSQA